MIDLFASPGTLAPMVVGLTSLMFSWAVGGDPARQRGWHRGRPGRRGVLRLPVGPGIGGDDQACLRSDDAASSNATKCKPSMNWNGKLEGDQDHRTETCLAQLRNLYETFQHSCLEGHVVATHHQLVSQAEQIFNASVQQLERSLELYQISQKLTGKAQS